MLATKKNTLHQEIWKTIRLDYRKNYNQNYTETKVNKTWTKTKPKLN